MEQCRVSMLNMMVLTRKREKLLCTVHHSSFHKALNNLVPGFCCAGIHHVVNISSMKQFRYQSGWIIMLFVSHLHQLWLFFQNLFLLKLMNLRRTFSLILGRIPRYKNSSINLSQSFIAVCMEYGFHLNKMPLDCIEDAVSLKCWLHDHDVQVETANCIGI